MSWKGHPLVVTLIEMFLRQQQTSGAAPALLTEEIGRVYSVPATWSRWRACSGRNLPFIDDCRSLVFFLFTLGLFHDSFLMHCIYR